MKLTTTLILSIALAVTGCATEHVRGGADRDGPPVELAQPIEKPAEHVRTFCDRWCFWVWTGSMVVGSLIFLGQSLPNVPKNQGGGIPCEYSPGPGSPYDCPQVANAKRAARDISLQLHAPVQ